jgi:hypothetical protein
MLNPEKVIATGVKLLVIGGTAQHTSIVDFRPSVIIIYQPLKAS